MFSMVPVLGDSTGHLPKILPIIFHVFIQTDCVMPRFLSWSKYGPNTKTDSWKWTRGIKSTCLPFTFRRILLCLNKMVKRRMTTVGREFNPFAGKCNCVSSLTPVMETLVLQVLMCVLISDYAEQVGPCPHPWALGTLLETVLPSSTVKDRINSPCM